MTHHRHRGRLPPWCGRAPRRGRGPVRSRLAALRSDPRIVVASLPGQTRGRVARPARRRCRSADRPLLRQPSRQRCGHQDRGPGSGRAGRCDACPPGSTAHVDFATSMVDRITPATTDEDRALVRAGMRVRRRVPGADRTVQRVGCVRGHSRPAGHAGRKPVPPWSTMSNPSSSASSGYSTGRTRCWPTPAASGATDQSTKPSPTRLPGLGGDVLGRGQPPSHPAGRRHSRIPGSPAGRGSPTPASGTSSRRSPRTARPSWPCARCRPSAPSEQRDGCPPAARPTVAAWVLHLRGLGAPIKDAGAGAAH